LNYQHEDHPHPFLQQGYFGTGKCKALFPDGVTNSPGSLQASCLLFSNNGLSS